ncbi:MAG: gamma carbonic anhydrase family protein [Chitinophagales bacterium]|nr:gamma carbonic anhydrase family protein [Chitinophagales bacterium]
MSRYEEQLKAQVKIGKNVFIAPNATILGNISLADNVSIWYGAILRADMDAITIGCRTNVQDGVIMHTDPLKPITVGEENIIGHGAILHGCTIGNNNLIGIRSTVLNKARIGNYCIIGAHALITEGMEVPDYSMVLGSPGKIVKQLPDSIIDQLKLGAFAYVHEAMKYLES